MASIGSLFIGGRNSDGTITSSYSCELEAPPNIQLIWTSEDASWEVEAKPGEKYIVARTKAALSIDSLFSSGINAIFRAIDTFAVNQHQILRPSQLRRHFKLIFLEDDRVVLRKVVNFQIMMTQTLTVTKKFKDGSTEEVGLLPKPAWHPSFRYYRLSQVAADLYEAYRNIYLAFESLCSEIFVRQENERESDWMKRCFRELHAVLNLTDLAPENCAEPGDYLFCVLYKDVRCNLFHAKAGTSILPFLEVDGGRVTLAYRKLVEVYRRAGAENLGFSSGGGVFTHAGFQHTMDSLFDNKADISVTDDSAPIKAEDIEVSPNSRPVCDLPDVQYLGQTEPGIILIRGNHSSPNTLPAIRRTCLLAEGKLFAGSDTPGGLHLENVDHFQCDLYTGLEQGNQPKYDF